MELSQSLKNVELFNGLTDQDLADVAQICTERRLQAGENIVTQGGAGDDLFLITAGYVEVVVDDNTHDRRVIVSLGEGQIIGEMSLLDQGPRSATVRACNSPTVVQVIERQDFETLCERNPHVGYIVMRNLALDLSFKLRHRNLTHGGH
jgi:CRP/FNR family transcriptional regulator, cyclic AMP receptor protein